MSNRKKNVLFAGYPYRDKAIFAYMQFLIRDKGMFCAKVSNFKECLKYTEDNTEMKFDLLVLDFEMYKNKKWKNGSPKSIFQKLDVSVFKDVPKVIFTKERRVIINATNALPKEYKILDIIDRGTTNIDIFYDMIAPKLEAN